MDKKQRDELLQIAGRALFELTPRQREYIRLYYVESLTLSQIAERWPIPNTSRERIRQLEKETVRRLAGASRLKVSEDNHGR